MDKIQKIKKSFMAGILLLSFLMSDTALAATLSFTPAVGTYEKDATFSVVVYVGSIDKSMNAASGTVTFPTDKLQVVSISKNNSIIDFWAQEPTFSNTNGTIKFEGVALPPGFQGGNGRLITITFKGKSTGIADVKMNGGQVLANDGVGTSILSTVTGATFTIKTATTPPPEVIDLDEETPIDETVPIIEPDITCDSDSIIYSTTHPGQIWRKENTAVFSWDITDDIVASRISFDKSPSTEPSNLSKPAIVEKKYENLADGTWYFHLSLQDNDGWSKTEHFKIQIDQTAPELVLSEVKRSDLTNPKPVIDLEIKDNISCIKEFSVNIDGVAVDYNKLPDGNYELETIDPGEHELSVIVHDRAGNQNEAYIDIVVEPLSKPVIKEYVEQVAKSDQISVKGETITNANLTAKITSKNKKFIATDEFQSGSGKFTWRPSTKLKSGTYFISFKVTDARGASSAYTDPITIKIGTGVEFDPGAIIDRIPPEVAMGGLALLGILLIIFITRALTMSRIRRRIKEDGWE
jgi:hypothetical protein